MPNPDDEELRKWREEERAREETRAIAAIEKLRDYLFNLHGGDDLPASWLKSIKATFFPPKQRGRHKLARVQERNMDIAMEMLNARYAIKTKKESKGITQIAEDIASRHGRSGRALTARDVFRIEKEYGARVMGEAVAKRMTAKDPRRQRKRAALQAFRPLVLKGMY